jgi:hypothetical protein
MKIVTAAKGWALMASPTGSGKSALADLHLQLCQGLLAELAPAEAMLVPAAVQTYRRDPERYEGDPTRLGAVGGGELGGAGIGDAVQMMLPYVTALAGMGLQLVLQTAQQLASDAAADGVSRWWRRRRPADAAPATVGPLTSEQVDRLGRLIDDYGQRWRLDPKQLARMRSAMVGQFEARFGRAGD